MALRRREQERRKEDKKTERIKTEDKSEKKENSKEKKKDIKKKVKGRPGNPLQTLVLDKTSVTESLLGGRTGFHPQSADCQTPWLTT